MPVKVRYIEFSPDEWLAGTAMLTDQERGIYWQACALIYSRGGPIETELLRSSCPGDQRPFRRCLEHLVALDKIQRFGSELSQKRCLTELERARKRSVSSSENGRKGGRPFKKTNGLTKPGGLDSARDPNLLQKGPKLVRSSSDLPRNFPRSSSELPRNSTHHSNKTNGLAKPDGLDSARAPANEKLVKPDASSSELAGLTAGDSSPLAAARGDGAAPPANQKPETTVFDDPQLRADAIAALGRCLDAVRGKLPVLEANATVPPPDPRLVQFRARLQRLNTLAGERLRGGARIEAWDVIGRASELGDPLALSPDTLAGLDAIESLEPHAEAAE